MAPLLLHDGDRTVLDLEEAVPDSTKVAARLQLGEALHSGVRIWDRVNNKKLSTGPATMR